MSIKSLLNTIVDRSTDTIEASARTVAGVGKWAEEWADSLNSEKAKQARSEEREMELDKRLMKVAAFYADLDVDAIKTARSKAKEVRDALNN